MANESKLLSYLTNIQSMAPSGYALALHVQFAAPTLLLQTYPKPWTDYYSQKGLVMSDPTVAWGFQNVGSRRWSDLEDPAGVMAKAAEHGLTYGATCALDLNDSRSLFSFARADREFSDDEIAQVLEHVTELHRLTDIETTLAAGLVAKLINLGVRVEQSTA